MKLIDFLFKRSTLGMCDSRSEATVMKEHNFTLMGDFDERDIFVCGWPKSGNTWCQRLFSGVVWGLDTNVLTDQLAQFLQPDVHYKTHYYRFVTPTLFKSHLPPQPEYHRVIFLVRDGRDALVSYWRMLRKDNPQLKLEDLFHQGDSLFPCAWETHARAWLANPFGAEVVTLRYEDLLTRAKEELRRVAEFIGSVRTDAELQHIAAGSEIDKMRRVAEVHGWDNRGSKRSDTFLGPGRPGSFRQEMSSDLQEAFLQRAGDMLERFGYV